MTVLALGNLLLTFKALAKFKLKSGGGDTVTNHGE